MGNSPTTQQTGNSHLGKRRATSLSEPSAKRSSSFILETYAEAIWKACEEGDVKTVQQILEHEIDLVNLHSVRIDYLYEAFCDFSHHFSNLVTV
jgi:hypothetical protein